MDRGNSFSNGASVGNGGGPYDPRGWYAAPEVSIYTLAEGERPA